FLPLSVAQRLFGLAEQVNSVQIVLADEVAAEPVQQEITRLLPLGLRVQQPLARGAIGRNRLLSVDLALHSMSLVALAGAAFVLLNSFLMNLGERRRQFAILRSLGMTRRQLISLLLREAFVLGFAGALPGLVLGAMLTQGLVAVNEGLLGL